MAALLGALQRGYRVMLPPNGQPETIRDLSRTASALLHDVDGGDGLDVRTLEPALLDDAAGQSGLRPDLAAQSVAVHLGSTVHPRPRKALGC